MIRSIYEWTTRACAYIRFKPDRAAVAEELSSHYEDHRDALLRGGEQRFRAERLALEALGDPDEVGRQLNRTHKPYLGWAWVLSRWVVGLMALLCVYGWFKFPIKDALTHYVSGYPTWYGAEAPDPWLTNFSEEPREGASGRVLGVCTETARAGEYELSVERAAAERGTYEVEGVVYPYDEFNLILRAEADCLTLDTPYAMFCYLRARDSLGNDYANIRRTADRRTDQPHLSGNPYGRRLRDHYFQVWLQNFDADARWVELYYDRMGVSFTLRIDLTGGAV